MATNTYVALDKVTVGTAVSTLTLSSISQGYTDLVLVANLLPASSARFKMQVNGDTNSNYSYTVLTGNGTAASSGRESTINNFNFYWNGIPSGWSNYTINLQNYSNTTTYKTVLMRGNSTAVETFAQACLWRSTAAITSITLFSSVGTFDVGSTFSLYGIKAATANLADTAKATGGTITYTNTDVIHTFTSSGTFTPSSNLTCDYLVVAGGGGGGSVGGGGGAGGFRTSFGISGKNSNPESQFTATASTGYTVTIGSGGTGGFSDAATNGSNSVFGSITSTGGGAGGGNGTAFKNAGNGGSGGGARGSGTAGTGTTGQGYDGSLSTYGGGGGAGAPGASGGTDAAGANGGIGIISNISGTYGYYAGGGGSVSSSTASSGGAGGGANGGVYPAAGGNGAANSGGGAGGGGDGSRTGAGGSGIVIVRYAK